MNKKLRILILQDQPTDAELVLCELRHAGFEPEWKRVMAEPDYLGQLDQGWEIIVADYSMPQLTGLRALELLKKCGWDIPLIILSSTVGEIVAVEAMKAGASDYVIKGNLARLPQVVERELREATMRREFKQAQEALRWEQKLMMTLMENLPDCIYFKDLSSRFLRVNPAMAKLFGVSDPSQLIGKSDADFFGGGHAEKALADEQEIIRSGQPMFGMEEKEIYPNGILGWVLTSKLPLRDGAGIIIGTYGISTNITERKQAEIKLRESERQLDTLMSNLPGMAYRCRNDEDWTMEFVSGGARALTGYSASELTGDHAVPYSSLMHPGDRETVRNQVRENLRWREPFVVSYRLRTATGEESWVWEQGRGVFDEQGRLLALEGFITDITGRKRAEEEREKLEAQNRQLQKNESLGRMAEAIAHHFNNQLQAVMMNLEMSMDGLPKTTKLAENLTDAMHAARKAADVSGAMLTYLGHTFSTRGPMDLSEACQRGLTLLRISMPKAAALETGFPLPGPIIRSNDHEIQQVLTNLVTNAWEAGGEGSVFVRVNITTVVAGDIPSTHGFPIDRPLQDRAYACMEVADAGCGISAQNIEKIFDPFFSTKFTGRGLGLSAVLGIVRALDGAITVESKPGEGSVFRVFLPLSEQAVSLPEIPPGLPAAQMPEGVTALVVEDEPWVRKIIAMVLEEAGFAVLEAEDGVVAMEIFTRHRHTIGLVLCDVTMPRMDGWETLGALRKLAPKIPVIFISGYNEEKVMQGDHPELPHAFLRKPHDSKALKDAIALAMANRS